MLSTFGIVPREAEKVRFDAQFAALAPLQATIYKVNIRSTAMLDIAILRVWLIESVFLVHSSKYATGEV